MMKITLPPDAAEALQKDGAVKLAAPPVPVHPAIRRVCRERAFRTMFGAGMRPTLRARCLQFVSFSVLAHRIMHAEAQRSWRKKHRRQLDRATTRQGKKRVEGDAI